MTEALQDAVSSLRQTVFRIQVQGRALTEDEMLTVERIHRALPLLEQALSILQGDATGGLK